MKGSNLAYEEELLNEQIGQDSGVWSSIIYENDPIAYINLTVDDAELLNPTGKSVQNYDNFLKNLDGNRADIDADNINSYDIIERAYEVHPGILHNLAEDAINREIDVEIMSRFDDKDSKRENNDIDEDFDMLFEGMDEIMEELLRGRLNEFKGSMDRDSLVQESVVVYADSLEDLYREINQLQTN